MCPILGKRGFLSILEKQTFRTKNYYVEAGGSNELSRTLRMQSARETGHGISFTSRKNIMSPTKHIENVEKLQRCIRNLLDTGKKYAAIKPSTTELHHVQHTAGIEPAIIRILQWRCWGLNRGLCTCKAQDDSSL